MPHTQGRAAVWELVGDQEQPAGRGATPCRTPEGFLPCPAALTSAMPNTAAGTPSTHRWAHWVPGSDGKLSVVVGSVTDLGSP